MSEKEIIGGIAACMNKSARSLEPTHDWRKVKRRDPGDTGGAQAARALAETIGALAKKPDGPR